ncbi:Protein artichoke [Eumeta japonica]|uniref:Protein artichoke n=1 Tax=Eumeta variegata TaxID=151549 RepID=A0A4C1XMB4_EUMVA|nr:Protein artichoke [Eumeta japonica]
MFLNELSKVTPQHGINEEKRHPLFMSRGDFILYTFILRSSEQSDDGCRYMKREYCEYDAICRNFVNREHYEFNGCNEYSPITLKVQLSFTETPSSGEVIPAYENYYMNLDTARSFIKDLDLSNDGFESTPPIYELKNLVSLNFSHNRLNTAKFFNKHELRSLTVLDLSYNVIGGFVPESGQVTSHDHETMENDASETPSQMYFFKSLLYLNMSNNYLTSIPIASFDSMSALKWLDLSNNYIDLLDVMSFDGIKRLEHLDLSHNRLVDLNSALLRFTELRDLYLSYNSITKLNVRDFKNLIKLRLLDLKHNSLLSLDHHIFSNTANLISVDLSYNSINTVFNDIFSSNSTSLHTVDISHNKLNNLPKSVFKGNELKKFSIQGNELEGDLERGIFDGLQNVDILDLSGQNLSAINNYAFFGCNKLTVLILANNKLINLQVNSMRLLSQLVTLDISKNKLQNIDFDKSDLRVLDSFIAKDNVISHINNDTFSNLTNLQYLDLSNNAIINIEKYAFQSLLNLINLQISNNPFDGVIGADTFKGLISLPELDLSQIHLIRFNNASLKGMNALRKVNLSSNSLTKLEYDSFSDTVAIEVIDLSKNSLTAFKINPLSLPNLNTLVIDYNNLTALTSSTFQQLLSLTKISVSNNNLSFIGNDTFRDQAALEFLDLSYNPCLSLRDFKPPTSLHNFFLSGTKADIAFANPVSLLQLVIEHTELIKINELKLMNCYHLLELDLSYNRIVQIEGDAFFSTAHLRFLDISFNELSDIKPGVFKDNEFLYSLNMSHNSLTSLSFGIFRGLRALHILDLSYNFLTSLTVELFYEAPSLKNLKVDYNNIQNIDNLDFGGISLELLSVGDNPLPCESLIKLKKKYAPFITMTSIKQDHQRENVDGITCNRGAANHSPNRNTAFNNDSNYQVMKEMKSALENNSAIQNQNILLIRNVLENSLQIQNESVNQIKTLLMNYSMSQSHNSDIFSNLSLQLKNDALELHNSTLESAEKYLKQSSNANSLLEKILNALTGTNKHQDESNVNVIDSNGTLKDRNLTETIQKWEDTISTLKTNILKEMNEKLEDFYKNHSARFDEDNIKPTNQKLTSEGTNYNSSLLFLEKTTQIVVLKRSLRNADHGRFWASSRIGSACKASGLCLNASSTISF